MCDLQQKKRFPFSELPSRTIKFLMGYRGKAQTELSGHHGQQYNRECNLFLNPVTLLLFIQVQTTAVYVYMAYFRVYSHPPLCNLKTFLILMSMLNWWCHSYSALLNPRLFIYLRSFSLRTQSHWHRRVGTYSVIVDT